MSGPLFGIVPAGQPLITDPSSSPSPTSLLFALPSTRPFSHIVVFLLPNVALPENTAAAIYLSSAQDVALAAQSNATPTFRFLGAVGPGKESAMFRVGSGSGSSSGSSSGSGGLMLGISIEPADAVSQRLLQVASSSSNSVGGGGSGNNPPPSQLTTAALAQRIIQNAFNFLTGFSDNAGPNGVEVVPLKAFEDWWRKFESRIRSDPSFLERQSE